MRTPTGTFYYLLIASARRAGVLGARGREAFYYLLIASRPSCSARRSSRSRPSFYYLLIASRVTIPITYTGVTVSVFLLSLDCFDHLRASRPLFPTRFLLSLDCFFTSAERRLALRLPTFYYLLIASSQRRWLTWLLASSSFLLSLDCFACFM